MNSKTHSYSMMHTSIFVLCCELTSEMYTISSEIRFKSKHGKEICVVTRH